MTNESKSVTTEPTAAPIKASKSARAKASKARISHKKNARVTKRMNENRDYSKFAFNSMRFGKGKLFLALVTQYIKDHPGISADAVNKKFAINGNYDTVLPLSSAKRLSGEKKRYFIGPDQVVTINKKPFAVTNQITSLNLPPLIKAFRAVGYNVRPATK